MPVFRLIYVSRVARQVRFADAEAIAQGAVERNTANGLSGMLVYTPSHFIQVLEGEESLVRATLARIRNDPRHTDLQVLDARLVAARQFDRWAMVAHHHHEPGHGSQPLNLERALEILQRAGKGEP